MTFTLPVFDLHTDHDDDFSRHKALGNMILEENPDEIIIGGDFASLDSCSSYDVVKRCSMADDLAAVKHAYECIFGPMNKWNNRRRKTKHKQYRPKTYWLEGNHEEREKRIRKADPQGYASLIDFDAMIAPPSIWQHKVEYGQFVTVRGIHYTHIPLNKMGKPMSMAMMRKMTAGHTIFGHTHFLHCETIALTGNDNACKMLLNAPALMRQDRKEHYCERNTTGWVYGLLRVRPQGPTRPFTFDFISTEELETMYL